MVFLPRATHNTKRINSNFKVSAKSIHIVENMYKPRHILPLRRGLTCSCKGKLNVQIKKLRQANCFELDLYFNSYFTEVRMPRRLSDNCSGGTY